jgi:hypothetical protein
VRFAILCLFSAVLLPGLEIDPGLLRMSGSFDLLALPPAGQLQAGLSRIHGGASIGYEAVLIEAETITYRLRGLSEAGRSVLSELHLISTVDPVRIDTRQSRLPGLGARLLLQADTIDLDAAALDDGGFDYRLLAALRGPASGTILVDDRWAPVELRGQGLELALRLGIEAGRLRDPTLRLIRCVAQEDVASLVIEQPEGFFRVESPGIETRFGAEAALREITLTAPARLERRDRESRIVGLHADGGINLPLPEGDDPAEGSAQGGVELTLYDTAAIGDRMDWQLSRSEQGLRVQTWSLSGSATDPLRLTSPGGRLPIAADLRARRLAVRWLASLDEGLVYEVVLEDIEPCAGRLRDGEAWIDCTIAAQTLRAELLWAPDGGLRLRSLQLDGGQAPASLALLQGPWPGRFTASRVQVRFDALGGLSRCESSADAVFEGLAGR